MKVFIDVFSKILLGVFLVFSVALMGLYLKAAIDYHNRSPLEVLSAESSGIPIDLGGG